MRTFSCRDLLKNRLQRPALAADPIDCHLAFQEQPCPARIKFRGIFDADYAGLHMSYMHSSPLKCFSKSQKARQRNFSLLAPVVVLFPCLRRPVTGFLVFLPLRWLYLGLYCLAKAYMVETRIYPVKRGLKEKLGMALKSLRLELFKHSGERPA